MSNLRLNRKQLSEFLSSPQTIRAFEDLFIQAQIDQPANIDAAQLVADNASAQAALALTMVADLASQLALVMTAQELTQPSDTFVPPVSNDTENHNTKSLVTSAVTMFNGAGSSTGTLTNAPVAGNPTKWIPIIDNGVTRYVPTW